MINELNAAQMDTVGGGLRFNIPQALTTNLDLRTSAELVAILLVSMCPELSFIKDGAQRFFANFASWTAAFYFAHKSVNWAIDHGAGDLVDRTLRALIGKNDQSSSEDESQRSVNL